VLLPGAMLTAEIPDFSLVTERNCADPEDAVDDAAGRLPAR